VCDNTFRIQIGGFPFLIRNANALPSAMTERLLLLSIAYDRLFTIDHAADSRAACMSPVRFIRFSCWYSEVSIIARYPRVDSRPDTGIQFLYVKQVYSRRLEPRMMHNTAWVVRTPMSIYLLCHIHSNCYANIKRESPTNKAYSRDFIQMQIKKFRHDHANS